jgi:hypothetical protein
MSTEDIPKSEKRIYAEAYMYFCELIGDSYTPQHITARNWSWFLQGWLAKAKQADRLENKI